MSSDNLHQPDWIYWIYKTRSSTSSRRTRWSRRRRICFPTSTLTSPRGEGLIKLVLFSFVLFPYSLTPHQIPEQKKCIRIVRLPLVVSETAVEDKIKKIFLSNFQLYLHFTLLFILVVFIVNIDNINIYIIHLNQFTGIT